jgi:hypothetical protein
VQLAYLRALNSPLLTKAQREACKKVYSVTFTPDNPAVCGVQVKKKKTKRFLYTADTLSKKQVVSDCWSVNGTIFCAKASGGSERIYTSCVVNRADTSLYCCPVPEDGSTKCDFVGTPQLPQVFSTVFLLVGQGFFELFMLKSCFAPAWDPPSYCLPTSVSDPPFGTPLRPGLWTICPWEKIVLSPPCIHFECDGSAIVPLNATATTVALIQQNVLQGIGIDCASTALDLVGAIFEHIFLAKAMRPIVL